ncbi:STAS domain-containing protein [Streptomonospora halotolerans]|nr:STAS domain-containing protein [Streptomonospora nanhaiensis]
MGACLVHVGTGRDGAPAGRRRGGADRRTSPGRGPAASPPSVLESACRVNVGRPLHTCQRPRAPRRGEGVGEGVGGALAGALPARGRSAGHFDVSAYAGLDRAHLLLDAPVPPGRDPHPAGSRHDRGVARRPGDPAGLPVVPPPQCVGCAGRPHGGQLPDPSSGGAGLTAPGGRAPCLRCSGRPRRRAGARPTTGLLTGGHGAPPPDTIIIRGEVSEQPDIGRARGGAVVPAQDGGRDADEQIAVVPVLGEIDIATADDMYARLLAAGPGRAAVAADLSRVEFFDASGVRALVSARRRLAERGVRLVLGEPSHAVVRTLEVLGLADSFDVLPLRELPLAGHTAAPN